jgi:hypothetical protein
MLSVLGMLWLYKSKQAYDQQALSAEGPQSS